MCLPREKSIEKMIQQQTTPASTTTTLGAVVNQHKQTLDQQLQQNPQNSQSASSQAPPATTTLAPLMGVQNSGNLSFSSNSMSKEDEEMTRSAILTYRAKEEEIERKKMVVREKVQAQLGRVEEETKRLALIREELEGLADPMRKEVAVVRKKIDLINKELKPLGQSCQKKEREYREALETFNDKNKEKAQLLTKLMELVGESERLRMKRLEELSKNIESYQSDHQI